MVEVYRAGDSSISFKAGSESEKVKEKKKRDWWKELVDGVLEKVGIEPGRAMMGAFNVRPDQRFVSQQEDEEIVLLLRAHPITNLGWVLLVILMLILPSVILGTGVFAAVLGKFVLIGKLVWYLVTLMIIMEKFMFWYYSVFIVTNERVVDIDFDNLMYRQITYANLNHIEEPEETTGGFIRSIFQYGDVVVTTASEKPTLEANAVPYPDKVVDVISRLAEELEKRRERGE